MLIHLFFDICISFRTIICYLIVYDFCTLTLSIYSYLHFGNNSFPIGIIDWESCLIVEPVRLLSLTIFEHCCFITSENITQNAVFCKRSANRLLCVSFARNISICFDLLYGIELKTMWRYSLIKNDILVSLVYDLSNLNLYW